MTVQAVFKRITSALEQAGIPYMFSGSFASAYYGSARSTQDIDIVIHAGLDQLRSFLSALPKSEYYAELGAALEAHQRQSMFNVIDLAAGWKIDFIVRKPRPYSQEEFRRRRQVILHGVSLFMTTAEDAIVSKLEWAKLGQSQRQIEDVAAILMAQRNLLDHSYLQQWVTELNLKTEWEEANRLAGPTI